MREYLAGQMNIFDLDFGVGKTSPEPLAATGEKISEELLKKWRGSSTRPPLYLSLIKVNGDMPVWLTVTDGRLPGEQWMPNFSESPKEEEESFLSEILQDAVPQKYFLSEKACLGILRRSQKRGKTLPEVLLTALVTQAGLSWERYEELKKEWMVA